MFRGKIGLYAALTISLSVGFRFGPFPLRPVYIAPLADKLKARSQTSSDSQLFVYLTCQSVSREGDGTYLILPSLDHYPVLPEDRRYLLNQE